MAQARNKNKNLFIAAGAAVVVVVGALFVFGGGGGGGGGFTADPDFNADALRDRIEHLVDEGNSHVRTAVDYGTEFPASGDHAPLPWPPGFYEDAVISEALVHSLEHGYIVIYYDKRGSAALDQLRSWTLKYQGNWDGMVAVPHAGLGEEIVLTAWAQRLRLDRFDPDAAWIFIDDYRGRGPENAVR